MPTVSVDLAERSYDVLVDPGLLSSAGSLFRNHQIQGRLAVISDSIVAPLHATTLLHSLEQAGYAATLHTVPSGESSKSLAHAAQLCGEMAAANHDRRSTVVALGGGVIGDLAGLVAAIFYRGIPFVQIPTTIVSQVDSSVGGKTGVNLPEGKNLVGAFHQPALVLADPLTLTTLPPREFYEGFAKVIKHAAIRDGSMFADIAALQPDSREVPADLIARNIAIKARIVEADERETLEIRALLNLGHTIGHGIEAAVPYGEMLHGEAISLGLRAALFLSERHANLNPQTTRTILRLLHHFQLPLVLQDSIADADVLHKLSRDKKFVAGNIRFVLLRQPGDAYVSQQVTSHDIIDAIRHLRTSPDL